MTEEIKDLSAYLAGLTDAALCEAVNRLIQPQAPAPLRPLLIELMARWQRAESTIRGLQAASVIAVTDIPDYSN